jgi:DNA recombination protein RmuC
MIDLPALILILASLAAITYLVMNQIKSIRESLKESQESQVLMEWLKEMKSSVDKNSDVLEKQLHNQRTSLEERLNQQTERMDKHTKLIWERLTEAQRIIGDVNKQIGGIEEFGKDIKDLSNVLKSPKLRGGLGEQFLNELLANALPHDLFKIQYEFKDGSKCDAAILTEKGIIPIDSKFSLENFRAMMTAEREELREKHRKEFVKDVKKRVDEIATKYLKPDEGTTEFALMYVPSETVYYDLIVNSVEVEDYAQQKNVFITSPNTLFSKLKIFLSVYQQFELQKHATEILKALASIKIEAEKFDEDLGVLEKHISNASKASENVRSKYTKLFGKIENVNEIGKEEKPLELTQ